MRRQSTPRQTNPIPPIELEPRPSSGRRAKRGLRTRSLAVGVVGTLAISALSINPLGDSPSPIAEASGTSNKVSLFLSAPLVMGTGVTDAGLVTANFDSLTVGTTCPGSLPGIVSLTFNACHVANADEWGGATTDTSVRTFGGTGTRYMTTSGGAGDKTITFTLSSPAKYVGLWWSAGNTGNKVRFLDSAGTLVAELDADEVESKLGGAITDITNRPTGSVTAIDGVTQYSQMNYRGNPRFYNSLTTINNVNNQTYPFVYSYLNLFVEGSLNITKVQFTGGGFEFDNLAISTVEQTPEPSMVKVLEVQYDDDGEPFTVLAKTPPNLQWAPNTSMTLATNPTTATVSQRATSSAPTITYAVKDAGTTGCTFDSTPFVLSYSAVGNCIVTATSSGTDDYETETVDRTFVVSAAVSNNSGGGSSGSSGSTLSATQALPVDPCSIPTSELEARNSKAFSGFAINSAVVTKKMKRQIKRWVEAHPEKLCVSVTGFTMGPRVLPTDPKLAKDRARAVRAYIRSLRPEASFMPITSRTQRLVGDEVRRAKVTLRF
jgi:hypothetical protein